MNQSDARNFTVASCNKFNITVPPMQGFELCAYVTDGGAAGPCLHYVCPHCGYAHIIPFLKDYGTGPRWEWNGSLARPTLTPSIRCHYPAGHEALPAGGVCHHFLNDGKVGVCGDSSRFPDSNPAHEMIRPLVSFPIS